MRAVKRQRLTRSAESPPKSARGQSRPTEPRTSTRCARTQIARFFATGEPRPFGIHSGDVVFSSCIVGRSHQRAHDFVRMAGVGPHHVGDLGRADRIGQSVAAEQQGRVLFERMTRDVDEIRIVGFVPFGTHVAVDLVAPRMLHRLALAQLPVVFALPHRRVIARQLLDVTAAELVKPRVAHMTDDDIAVGRHRDGEDARHPLPFGAARAEPVDLVVREGNGLANAILGRAGFPFQAGAHDAERRLRRGFAGRLPADPVDDDEDAARGVG